MKNRAGTFITQLSGDAAYKSFNPTPLQEISIELSQENLRLITATHRLLGQLDSISSQIPNIDLFVGMYIRKEALLSSQIEGTQATLDDILDPAVEENQNANVAEVLNYIKAINYALNELKTLPLCMRLLKNTHLILLSGLRGSEKNPGEFRHSQNWIGAPGSTLKTASFIPPSLEDMGQALSMLEKYINDDGSDENTDILIKTALIHYQFETIHPFLDGNGRIGRLLTILFLIDREVLSLPILYVSYFLKINRVEYYDRLMEVRRKGTYEQWISFFINALREAAIDAINTTKQLSELRAADEQLIKTLGRAAKTALLVYKYLLQSPIIEIGKTSAALGLSYNTVSKAVENLKELNILSQTQEKKRNRHFSYSAYLGILRKNT